ncbi:MAG: MFS transporter [Spirochaetales bacterium]|uniref:MFS transporter n=1 Tax=Candidatus Thalassospirochaeta sargassi TaxID=3119039 RepID=A0AAJ1MNH0_9SPIO|nr:MFS transporter [Spirochaetales bacterium]
MKNAESPFTRASRAQRLSYSGFMIHGIFLALAVTFTEVNTVLPALIIQSGGSDIHIGILTTIMIGLPLISQLLFSPFLQSRKQKKPFLLAGIYARMSAFYLIGFLLFSSEAFSTGFILLMVYVGLILFTLSGAFAGITYVSLIGSTIPQSLRSRFFLNKQFFWSIGVFLSGLLTRYIISAENGMSRYGLLFTMAASMLALASAGFWMIREQPVDNIESKPVRISIFSSMFTILKNDRTFRNYAITANLLSSSIVLIPFYMKIFMSTYPIDNNFIGTIVLLQTGGMILANLIWPRVVKPLGFKGMMRIQSVMGFTMPLLLTAAVGVGLSYQVIYVIAPLLGAMAGAQKMSGEAVLVQISPDDKRALYSGIYGALNLTSAIFPLLIAAILSAASWQVVFPAVSLLPLAALLSIKRMVCPIDIKKL